MVRIQIPTAAQEMTRVAPMKEIATLEEARTVATIPTDRTVTVVTTKTFLVQIQVMRADLTRTATADPMVSSHRRLRMEEERRVPARGVILDKNSWTVPTRASGEVIHPSDVPFEI
jgi:hypothetical protein